MTPAQDRGALTSRATRQRCTASSTLSTAWWMSATGVVFMTRAKSPNFNVDESKIPTYCQEHADDSMVNVRRQWCLQDFCTTTPHFNFEGNKIPAYCKHHAEDGMVNVRKQCCSQRLLHEIAELQCAGKQANGIRQAACRGRYGE